MSERHSRKYLPSVSDELKQLVRASERFGCRYLEATKDLMTTNISRTLIPLKSHHRMALLYQKLHPDSAFTVSAKIVLAKNMD